MVHYQETRFGFEYGCSKVTRLCSDKKTGAVSIELRSPKRAIQVYITGTGLIRVFDESDKHGWKRFYADKQADK